MQPTHAHVGTFRAIVVGDFVGSVGAGDVGLDDHQLGIVIEIQFLDVLILKIDLVVVAQVGRERR